MVYTFYTPPPPITVLVGLTLTSVTGLEPGSDDVRFETQEGRSFKLYHGQDCCESVAITEVIGDPADLLGHPILVAEEVSSEGSPAPKHADSYTWTFYRFLTIKGSVTVRWLGESNGYYSESVEFDEV